MTSDLEILSSRVHLPLMRLGMCLDCEACFEIGVTACPACGSKTWMPLARFLETARRNRMVQSVGSLERSRGNTRRRGITHHYVIVARDRRELYQHFKEGFADNPAVSVMFDRRGADRRSGSENAAVDRRRGDRRWRAVDEQLRVLGWAVVRVGVNSPTK
jgi:hypothetical protein